MKLKVLKIIEKQTACNELVKMYSAYLIPDKNSSIPASGKILCDFDFFLINFVEISKIL